MKNVKTNEGSFVTVKLQAKRLCLLAVLAALIGFSFASCGDDDGTGGGGKTPVAPIDRNKPDNGGATQTFTSVAEFETWLNSQPDKTVNSPYIVALNVSDLGGDSTTSGSAGYALQANSDKYVSLDLSGSTFTNIGDDAFYECTNLTGITIPSSVTGIGEQAFYLCTDLTSITIPDSVTSIGEQAFYLCRSLPSVTIPNSVTSIGKGAFAYCYMLNSVTIPDSVTSIVDRTFLYCTSLASVTIPDGVTSIGGSAFSECTRLTSVTIPNSVTSIDSGAFLGCTSLTSVTFQGTITSSNFGTSYFSPFDGDLRDKYFANGIGTYTRSSGSTVWTFAGSNENNSGNAQPKLLQALPPLQHGCLHSLATPPPARITSLLT